MFSVEYGASSTITSIRLPRLDKIQSGLKQPTRPSPAEAVNTTRPAPHIPNRVFTEAASELLSIQNSKMIEIVGTTEGSLPIA